ncbi:alpha/beta hydrolase [Candidatus Bipolaricaulota bacterium]|nr:alpha/beta hydrolase [Candidatus Bipolaricaulota bacterium]
MTTPMIAVHPNRSYGERDGLPLTFDRYSPENATGSSIIFVNSGGFQSGKLIQYERYSPETYRFLCANELTVEGSAPIPLLAQFSFENLLSAGFTVFDVKHSNAPHTFDKMLADVRKAIEWIHAHAGEFALDPVRIGIFGASSGGYLAIAAGLTAVNQDGCLVRAIAAYYPAGFDFPADVAAFPQIREGLPALAVDDSVLDSNSIKRLHLLGGPPTLVIYGDQDFPFILNPCRSICSEFPRVGIETKCVVIEGAAHEFMREDGYRPQDGDLAQEEMLDWFQQQLANGIAAC